MRTTHVMAVALAAISLGIAGCGGDDDDDDEPTVEVLATRANQVTGGNALIAIRPAGPAEPCERG